MYASLSLRCGPLFVWASFVTMISCATAAAQTPPRIIGVTSNTPLVVSQDVGTCALNACPVPLPPASSATPFAGGTAFDPRDRTLFVSTGLMMTKVDPRLAGCPPVCAVVPFPGTTPANAVTGLAYNESSNVLFVTDAANIIRWYSVAGPCGLTLLGSCAPVFTPGELLTGCATDDLNNLVFYATTVPGTVGGHVYVAPQSNPCVPICVHSILVCGANPMSSLTGLGFDSCARILWITDGRLTLGHSFDSITCSLLPQVQCCVNGSGDPYIGLCVLPSTEQSAGPSCSALPCPNCPTMLHRLVGDPTIGNPTFSLDLDNAPGGTLAWLFVNVGTCTLPGVLAPPFCTGILVPFAPPWISAGPVGTGGAAGFCNGGVNLVVGIPPNPLFCGLRLSTQYVGFCGGGGFFVSNCLSWMIGAS